MPVIRGPGERGVRLPWHCGARPSALAVLPRPLGATRRPRGYPAECSCALFHWRQRPHTGDDGVEVGVHHLGVVLIAVGPLSGVLYWGARDFIATLPPKAYFIADFQEDRRLNAAYFSSYVRS